MHHQAESILTDTDLLEIPEDAFRKSMSVISQRTYLFNTSIGKNISLARPGAKEEEIILATKQAGILGFINGLPKGFDTMVGERGARLSAGECQRVALARALLRNTSFFLLDEPTANLDPITEKVILGNILTLAKNKSVLLITHRLVNLERMDEILVLENGTIVERGTQDELLQKGGLYHRMYSLQRRIIDEN